MIKNYFKIAVRNLFRYKWNSLINILGLAIGIACFIYILLLLRFEINYDGFHADIERIYRIPMTLRVKGRTTNYAATPLKYGRYIKNNFDEVEKLARIKPWQPATFSYGDRKFIESNFKYVEQDILDIFTFEFIYGVKKNALIRPYTAIINNKLAQKYFGDQDPVGKLLMIDTSYFEITGVYQDLPRNSRLKLDAILSFVTDNPDQYDDWRAGGFMQTFIKLKPGVNPNIFKKKLEKVPELVNGELLKEGNEKHILYLQKLKDIHTDDSVDYTWDNEPITNPTYIYILFATGVFILIIASLNFINLSTAKYINRSKEVSIRKTVGAKRSQLIIQFLGESLMIVFLAHILGMFIIELALPVLNNITQFDIVVSYNDLKIWLIIVGIIGFIGVFAGSYPAFVLSSFNPMGVQNKKFIKFKAGKFRKLLVIIQYTVTLTLIIGTTFILRQVNYMTNKSLGFNAEQKMVLEFPRDLFNTESYKSAKAEFNSVPGVLNSCFSSSVPGKWRYKWRIWETGKEDQSKHIFCMQIDNDFFDVYNIEIIKGEKYFKENVQDSDWILNESGISIYDRTLDSALNLSLQGQHNIKAVASNYHFEGLQKEIEPLAFFKIQEDFRYLTLRLENGNIKSSLKRIQEKFETLYPDLVFNYFFLDKDFEMQYQNEKRIGKIFIIFTIVGMVIAIIGIFGLAVFTCQQKEKEIGIRKVNGASVLNIFQLLSFDFTRWILISFIISVPIAYWGISAWLNNFAYRVNISWGIILLIGIIAWIFAIITVSYQTLKSARKNPVKILRYE